MSEPAQFGASLTDHGVTFRLWAPAAASVKLVLNRKIPMPKSDGWFVLHVDDATAGTRYAFEIDDEITIPDPASHFQPEDVHGRSEVIDHAAFAGLGIRTQTPRGGQLIPGRSR